MDRIFFILGSLSALMGVSAGAFGAHGLKNQLPADMLSVFEVAVRYQMYHALALIAVAVSMAKWHSALIVAGGWLFVAGTVLFSGSLYLLSLSGIGWFGWITPIGGVAFLAGWACLLWGVWRHR